MSEINDRIKRNDEKIKRSFVLIQSFVTKQIESQMCKTLANAVDFALNYHEILGLSEHVEGKDDYGWMLVKDGDIVGQGYAHDDLPGTAQHVLQSLSWLNGRRGYVGCVMAGMTTGVFKFKYEKDVLTATAGECVFGFPEDLKMRIISNAKR